MSADSSNNLAIRTDGFRALEGFDMKFTSAAGEDRDFCHRFAASGGRLIYVDGAIVAHAHRLNPCTFLRQHFRYGRSARRFHFMRARRMGGVRIRLEPIAFFLAMVCFPFRLADQKRPGRQALLLLITQLAYVAGFVTELLVGKQASQAPGPGRPKAMNVPSIVYGRGGRGTQQ